MEGPDEVYTVVEYGDGYFTIPLHIYVLAVVTNVVFIAGGLYVYYRCRVHKPWILPAIAIAAVLPIALVVFLRQFRLLSFSLLALAAVAFCVFRRWRGERVVISMLGITFLSLFLPFDIAIGSLHFGSRHGTSPGGTHLVKVVDYPFQPETLIDRYGEYIVAGCGRPPLVPPRWMLVWD